MTTLEKCLAATALAAAVGLFAAASRNDHADAQRPADAREARVPIGPDGYPLTPTDGMSEMQWRRIEGLRLAAAGRAPAPEDPPAAEDGAIDSAELAGIDPPAFEQVVGSLDASRDDRLSLLSECNERRRALRAADAPAAPLELELSVESAAGVGRIVAVSADWPADVDVEAIECFRRAYVGHEFATDHDYSYRYKWPVCAPAPGARDDGPHPEIPATVTYEL